MKPALPLPENCELFRCNVLNLILLPGLTRFQRYKDWSTQKTTPNQTIHFRMSLFLMSIKRILNCPVATVLRTVIDTKLKICSIRHMNMVNVVVRFTRCGRKVMRLATLCSAVLCAVVGVRHPQHTQTCSNSSTIAAGSSNGVTNTRCCRYSCMRSWWWVEVPSEIFRAVSRYK
jgi:hypothetical protein